MSLLTLRDKIILFIYSLIGIVSIFTHELWRDEVQGWLIARDTTSFHEFVYAVRYEGHPALWYVIQVIAAHMWRNIYMLQIVHVSIGILIAYLILKFSPFPKYINYLSLTSFYFIYEYLYISRNYSLIILFAIVFCILNKRRVSIVYQCIPLFLMMQSHTLGLILSVYLLGYLLIENLSQYKKTRQGIISLCSVGLMMVIGIIVYIYFSIPLPDKIILGDPTQKIGAFVAVWRAFFPFEAFSFYNPTAFGFANTGLVILESIGSLLVIGSTAFLFRSQRKVQMLYVGGLSLFLIFFYVVHYYWVWRHIGIIFILFYVSAWLFLNQAPKHNDQNYKKLLLYFLTAVLIVQGIVGVYNVVIDSIYPFSMARETAEYIKTNNLNSMPILGESDDAALSVVGYLDRKIYYPRTDRLGTYVLWNTAQHTTESSVVTQRARNFIQQTQQPVLIINSANSRLLLKELDIPIKEIAEFKGGRLAGDEDYTLYIAYPIR